MKKFLVFLLLVAAGYFAYEYLIKEKPVLEIKADKVITVSNSLDADIPALAPVNYGSVQGTVKNLGSNAVNNILLKYQLGAQPVEAVIYRLEPGEERTFSTQSIIVRSTGVPFFLDSLSYEEEELN